MARYQALANLSVPQPGKSADPASSRTTDLVRPGEIVDLTDEVAQGFLRRHRVPVIRPAKEQNQPMPPITGRSLYNEPQPASAFGARPDPPGSSQLTVHEPKQVSRNGGAAGARLSGTPEFNEPQPGDGTVPAAEAEDIPVRR